MTEGLENHPTSVPRQHTFSMQPMGGQALAVFTENSSGNFFFSFFWFVFHLPGASFGHLCRQPYTHWLVCIVLDCACYETVHVGTQMAQESVHGERRTLHPHKSFLNLLSLSFPAGVSWVCSVFFCGWLLLTCGSVSRATTTRV